MRHGRKPRQDDAPDAGDGRGLPADSGRRDPGGLRSLPVESPAGFQLGLDDFDDDAEPEEVLIRVSTESLSGEDDLTGDESEPEAELAAEPEPEIEVESGPEAELAAEPEVESAPEAELAAEPEVAPEVELAAEPEIEVEPAVEAGAEAGVELLVEFSTEPEPEAHDERLEALPTLGEAQAGDAAWAEPDAAPWAQAGEGLVAAPASEVEPATSATALEPVTIEPELSASLEPAAALQPEETAQLEPEAVGESPEAGPADDAALQIRLARIHLRTGDFTIARAEFEALAARKELDTAANLDLAEVRWRCGDLQGAGEAAVAYLDEGGDEALGYVIAAEAAALAGHQAESRRNIELALESEIAELEPVFAGIRRRATWSSGAWSSRPRTVEPGPPIPLARADSAPDAAPATTAPAVEQATSQGQANLAEAAVPPAPSEARAEAPTAPPAPASGSASDAVAAPVAAAQPVPARIPEIEPRDLAAEARAETESGRSFLAAGDAMMAALHFAVAVRLAPESAADVLAAIGDRADLPLQLVRGDVLRILGLEGDAGRAYLSVASALNAPRSPDEAAAPSPAAPDEAAAPSPAAPDEAASQASVDSEGSAGPVGPVPDAEDRRPARSRASGPRGPQA